MGLLFLVVMGAAMYFLMLRPQQQRVRAQRELIASLREGDEVVTAGGIIGRITDLDDERVALEVSPTVVINLVRGAIAQRLGPPALDAPPDDDLPPEL